MLKSLRHIVRTLRKVPGYSTVVILTFALGIGATAAIFSVVHHVLLKPLPYPEAERLVEVWTRMPEANFERLAIAHGEYLDYRSETELMIEVGAYAYRPGILTDVGEPLKVMVGMTTSSLWSVLGVEAEIGRTLVEGDDLKGREPVVILSRRIWQSRFSSEPGVIGREVTLNGVTRTVIGVMPRSFGFPSPEVDIRLAIGADPRRVLAEVVKQGLLLAAVGSVVGLVGSVFTGRLLEGFLYGVARSDVSTYLATILVLALVVMAACLIPARRAASINPAAILRED